MNPTANNAINDPFPLNGSPAPAVDYASSYKKLQEIVERLKRGGPGDIDGLVENFRAGVAAYEACRRRLDSVRAEIDGELARLAPAAAADFA
jgi:exodeoxyribonuclease VII small subunit